MEKGYYDKLSPQTSCISIKVAIHNKNGKGLLPEMGISVGSLGVIVAIHNKNGKGLLQRIRYAIFLSQKQSQSTIKMEKGYYGDYHFGNIAKSDLRSQSTIKMEKGYYQ